MTKKSVCRALLCAVVMAVSAGAAAQDATLSRARQLISNQQYKQAYQLLAPQEQARAGDPEYDYLLGIAAIDAGELTRGVFALERVLAVNPNHAQARAEIARAYFLMGENKVARQEFENVRQSNPPAEVNATIDRFLGALDARERSRRSGITGYLEATFGHDSNVNSATSATQFAIPALGGTFNLAAGANEQDDFFMNVAGGITGRIGFNDSVGFVGSASFDQRLNFTEDQFNTGSLNASGGISVRSGGNEFLAALQAQQFDVEWDRYRNATGLLGQWRSNIGSDDQITAYAQFTRLSYPTQSARDSNRTVLGAAWAHAYGGPRSPVVFAGVYGGKEDTRNSNAPAEFSHDLYGLRVGGQSAISDKWLAHANASYERRDYGGPDVFFLRDREDRELHVRVGATYSMSRNWSFTPAVAWTDNKSNIVIYDYDRWILSVTARYDFR